MRMVSGDTLNYTYDALQRLTDKYVNGGVWERYTYDGTRVKTKKNWIGNTLTHQFYYEYDTVGNILSIKPDKNSSPIVTYTYDRLNQLTTAVHSNGRTETYSYDNAGNLKSFNNGIRSYTYTYGDGNWKDLLTAITQDGVTKTFTYDAIGNPLTYHNGYALPYYFTWGEGRRLETYTYGGQTTTYQYDADGLRTKKINPNGTYIVYYIADGRYLGEIHYTSAGIVDLYMRYNYDESGSVIGISLWNAGSSSAWTDYYFIKNLQGDILQVYEATNNTLVASYNYDSWGNVLSANNYATYDGRTLSQLNPFRYRSYYYDNETYFYYLQSRYYDPAIGRFINADDIDYLGADGAPLSYNLFAYCNNNPISRNDPTGNISALLVAGAVASVISGISNAINTAYSGGTIQECLFAGVAGTFGGAVGFAVAVATNFSPLGSVAARVTTTIVSNLTTSFALNGKITTSDILFTAVDATFDACLSTVAYYYNPVDSIIPQTAINAVADGVIDITETALLYTPRSTSAEARNIQKLTFMERRLSQ